MKALKDEFRALRFLGAFEEVRQLFNMRRVSRSVSAILFRPKLGNMLKCGVMVIKLPEGDRGCS